MDNKDLINYGWNKLKTEIIKNWINEASNQIYELQRSIKYLKSCSSDDYEEHSFFRIKDIVMNYEKQIAFLETGIKLIQERIRGK